MTIPTLGYVSRTDAVLALTRQGLGPREIASKLGIDLDAVYALRASGRERIAPRLAPVHRPRRQIEIDTVILTALSRPAAARGVSVTELVRQLLAAIVEDELVAAVLDDEEAVQ